MEPIDYQSAVRQIMARRRRQKLRERWRRLTNLRPASPTQMMATGLILILVGWLVPTAVFLPIIGLALCVLGFTLAFVRNRAQRIAPSGPIARRPPTGAG